VPVVYVYGESTDPGDLSVPADDEGAARLAVQHLVRLRRRHQALTDRGLRIPDDVAIVGYDNWEVLAADCRPPPTTVDLNLEQLSATAVHQLFAAPEATMATGVIRQPCRLVVRESTGPVAVG